MAHTIYKNLSYLVAENLGSDSKIPDYQDISFEYFNEEASFEKKSVMIENGTKMYLVPLGEEFENDDASWIMSCTFMIFTMQTGTGPKVNRFRHQIQPHRKRKKIFLMPP